MVATKFPTSDNRELFCGIRESKTRIREFTGRNRDIRISGGGTIRCPGKAHAPSSVPGSASAGWPHPPTPRPLSSTANPVNAAQKGGGQRAFDGSKQVKGVKRHLAVDVMGWLLAGPCIPPVSSCSRPKRWSVERTFG